jgi:hypothetical protein
MKLYMRESIKIEESMIHASRLENHFTSVEENFRLACRYFNMGYSLYRQFKKVRKSGHIRDITHLQTQAVGTKDTQIYKSYTIVDKAN